MGREGLPNLRNDNKMQENGWLGVKKLLHHCPRSTLSPDAQQQPVLEINQEINEGLDDYIDEKYVDAISTITFSSPLTFASSPLTSLPLPSLLQEIVY
uniref:Uncharacterized protein n=1 Tax=Romanomermis culicivorax TaxID=13658 RepID=A0A915HPW4_ROMCU